MVDHGLNVVLEAEKKSYTLDNAMFYRYGLGDYQFCFSQELETGNIYSLYLKERHNVENSLGRNLELYVRANEDEHGGYYPNEFEVRPKSRSMGTGDARKFMADLEKACDLLDAVKDFFKTSKHFELYCKGHGIEVENGNRDDLSQFGDELISREALLDDILAYIGRSGRKWASLDADWKNAWAIISNYHLEDGDLVSRGGLLDAVLDQFGCDLAYYDGDLRIFQEAIEMAPAVEKPLVDVLDDAHLRAGCAPCQETNEVEKGLF